MKNTYNNFILVIGICALNFFTANAQTNVSGFISSNTNWNLAGSPYIVIGNIVLTQGSTLTIEPGVEIRFNTNMTLNIDGELIAIGTPQDRITFTSNQGSHWNKIYFSDNSVNAILDVNGDYLSGSILKYCNVLNGGSLGPAMIDINRASPYFIHCKIMYSSSTGISCFESSCGIDSSIVWNCSHNGLSFWNIQATSCGLKIANDSIISVSGYGIAVDGGPAGCSTIIRNNYFSDNGYTSVSGSISFGQNLQDVSITENYFTNNKGGTSSYIQGDNIIFENNVIENDTIGNGLYFLGSNGSIRCNRFVGNKSNYWIAFIQNANCVIDGNIFDGNVIAGGGQSLLEVYGWPNYNSFTFSNNTFRNNWSSDVCCNFELNLNSQPFYSIYQNNFIDNHCNHVIGINVDFTGPPNNYLSVKHNNFSNPTCPFEFYNRTVLGNPDIYLDSNYWGSTNLQHIDSVIYDYFDNGTKSVVYNSNPAGSPFSPDSCASLIISTNDIEEVIDFTVFPNPAVSAFSVSFGKEISKGNITLLNLLGSVIVYEEIIHSSSKEISLPAIASGVYLVKLFDGSKYQFRKIIIRQDR